MRIEVTPTESDDEIALCEPDVFTAFSVRIHGDRPAGQALDRLGRVAEDDHVFVDPAVLRGLAGDRADDPRWLESLDGMIAFAAEHGWVDAGGFVRAHIERAA